MKEIFAGIAFIIVLGFGTFAYRAVVEMPREEHAVACTMDAKVCPDGQTVGRSGPSCEFSPCPLPNLLIPEAGITIVVPEGYYADERALERGAGLISVLVKESQSVGVPHTIMLRTLDIVDSAEETIVAQTRFQPSDEPAQSIDQFEKKTIGGRDFFVVVVERFEGQLHSLFYLPRENDVLLFEIFERDVLDWTNPALVKEELPEHSALIKMLETMQ